MVFRNDYTPEKILELINSDEPVFLLRAKDKTAVDTLRHHSLINRRKGNDVQADEISELVLNFISWQENNIELVKLPDSPRQLNMFDNE